MLRRGGFFAKKAACCKGRRLIHKRKYLSERGNQIITRFHYYHRNT
nr:MAG TPA: hypothetical protein [Bacteriophage sp.]